MRMNVADNRRFCEYGTYIASFQTRLRRSRVTRHVRTSSSIFLARLASPFVLHCVAAFLTVICWKPIDAQRSLASGVWATGEWIACEGNNCGPGGVQLRSVFCENPLLNIKITHDHCDSSSKPPDKRTCFKVCEMHRSQFEWRVKAWEKCRKSDIALESGGARSDATNCDLHSRVTGIQTRDVSCRSNLNRSFVVEDYICERFHAKPGVKRDCHVPCARNCVTSTFGPWSSCSSSCGNGTKIRTRSVLRNAKHDGVECPSLLEVRSCRGTAASCEATAADQSAHKLNFGEWSVCRRAQANLMRLSRNGNSKRSRRRRAQINEHLIGARSRHVTCLNGAGQRVGKWFVVNETCAVSQACTVVSSWSEWGNCTAQCGPNGTQTRTRKVQRLPLGSDSSSCPKLEESRECEVDPANVSVCASYEWAAGGWRACELIHNATCGGGHQSRDVYCVRMDRLVRRQAVAALRVSSAERARIWSLLQPVDDALCEQKRKFPSWRECDVPCEEKCVLGPWSDWSECALSDCTASSAAPRKRKRNRPAKGFRRRSRKVYQDFGRPEDCPSTLEVIPCDDARCYFWHVTRTSSCIPESKTCGKGTATRDLECRDMWREKVEDILCYEHHPPAVPLSRIDPCYVPCNQDCVLSDWSDWTPCPPTRKRGKRKAHIIQIRKQEILAYPGPTGAPCPREENLTQSRRCDRPKISAYFWSKSSWGPCQLVDPLASMPVETTASGLLSRDESSVGSADRELVFSQGEYSLRCGNGYQTRNVRCRKRDSGVVRNKMCMSWDEPVARRSCTVACRQDCVLTQWSTWGSCEKTCTGLAGSDDRQAMGTSVSVTSDPKLARRHRKRYVIQPRVGSGEPCRLELEQNKPCPDDQQCFFYRWRAQKWSPCVAVVGVSALFGGKGRCAGVMTRSIKCYKHVLDGEVHADRAKCLQHAGEIPPASKPCVTKCPRNVAFHNWLKKAGCRVPALDSASSGSSQHPFTTVDLEDAGESNYIPLQPISKPVGSWSSCFLDNKHVEDAVGDECPVVRVFSPPTETTASSTFDPADPQTLCGEGVRRRALGCFEPGTGVMLDVSYCYNKAFEEETCEVPCPQDCEMSPWSMWGPCGGGAPDDVRGEERPRQVCGPNLATRYRFAMALAEHGGRPCPSTDLNQQVYQSRPCRKECDETFWVTTSWDTCKMVNASAPVQCGLGFQIQNVDCYQTHRAKGYVGLARRLDDVRSCDLTRMPFGTQKCHMPCPGQCVLSKWSSWQPCVGDDGLPVGRNGTCHGSRRKRTRQILREPDESASTECAEASELTETENCALNLSCSTYRVEWTEWSSCLLGQDAQCGSGRMHRRAKCMTNSGHPVHPSKCVQHGVAMPTPLSRKCRVPCPTDCLVSDWSTWTTCSSKCNVSRIRTRSRKILRDPSELGRLCPEDLVQTRPCCFRPCYTWSLRDWKDCILPRGSCGVGTQKRVVQCVQQDGKEVHNSLCRQQQQGKGGRDEMFHNWFPADQLTRACRVPCPGECKMTEWSAWSRCHADCQLGVYENEKKQTGVRTRSRAGYALGQVTWSACLSHEIDEKECPAEEAQCFTYRWKTGPFVGNRRAVWCERVQDELQVSSGCSDAIKPHDTISRSFCAQTCSDVNQSYCSPEGLCLCNEPYRASYVGDVLRDCVDPEKQQDQGVIEEAEGHVVDFGVKNKTEKTLSSPPPVVMVPINDTSDSDDIWDLSKPVRSDGSLNMWVYLAIAGLAIVIVITIAIIYLTYSACRKPSKKCRRRKGGRQRGSNVGVGLVVTSTGGSAMFGTGGTGLPPYYATQSARYPAMRVLSRTPSAKSAASFPDRYDSDD